MDIIELSLINSTSFLMILAIISKLGVYEWLAIHSPKPISKMLQCETCLSFWSSLIFTAISTIFVSWMDALLSLPITFVTIKLLIQRQ